MVGENDGDDDDDDCGDDDEDQDEDDHVEDDDDHHETLCGSICVFTTSMVEGSVAISEFGKKSLWTWVCTSVVGTRNSRTENCKQHEAKRK